MIAIPSKRLVFTRTSEVVLNAFLKSLTVFEIRWSPDTNLVYVKNTGTASGVHGLVCQVFKSPRGAALRVTEFKVPAMLTNNFMVEDFVYRCVTGERSDKRIDLEILLTDVFQKVEAVAKHQKKIPGHTTNLSKVTSNESVSQALSPQLLTLIEHLALRVEGLSKRVAQLEHGQMRF